MGLIKKILKISAGVGLVAAGLPLSSWGIAIAGGIAYGMADRDSFDEAEQENETKMISLLNERYENVLNELNSNSLKVGDIEISWQDMDEQTKYEQMYDNFVSAFGDAKIAMTKEQYVNFMLANGNEVIAYVNSEEFKDRIDKVNHILEYNMNTNKGNLYTNKTKENIVKNLKEELEKDYTFWNIDSEELKHNKKLDDIGQALMITGIGTFGVGIVTALFFHFITDCGDDLPTAIGLFLCLPVISMIGVCLIIPGVTDRKEDWDYEG